MNLTIIGSRAVSTDRRLFPNQNSNVKKSCRERPPLWEHQILRLGRHPAAL